MDCVFCKIIKGEIPCYKIYEDKSVLAFLDIACDLEGHTIVIPKEHYENIIDCNVTTLNKTMQAVQKISKYYIDKCGFGGVQILNNCNETAGQSVMHLHFHILPYKKDKNNEILAPKGKTEMNLEKISKKLRIK